MVVGRLAIVLALWFDAISCTQPCTQQEQEHEHNNTCVLSAQPVAEAGEVLLQTRQWTVAKALDFTDRLLHDETPLGSSPLTKEGFETVRSTCCILAMDEWTHRKIDELGFEVCFEGGLSGLLPFISCNPSMTYEKMLAKLKSESTWVCPWLRKKGFCPKGDWPDSCPSAPVNPSWHRRRVCQKPVTEPATVTMAITDQTTTAAPKTTTPLTSTTTRLATTLKKTTTARLTTLTTTRLATTLKKTTTARLTTTTRETTTTPQVTTTPPPVLKCCAPKVSLISAVVEAHATRATKIQPFDCKAHPGPLMLWKDVTKDRHKQYYDIDELDVATGKYNRVYSIPTSLTSPAFMQLTAAGINPIDGVAYGFVSVSSQGPNWIVRFDESAMEFLSKVDHRSSAGTVSSKGTYYYIGWGKPVPILSIPEIHNVRGFPSASSSVPKLGKVVAKGWEFYVGDLAAYTGNIEGAGDGEYIVAITGETLLLVKDAGAQSKYWTFKTSPTKTGSPLGAAWNFQGKIYFTDNPSSDPFDVFEVPMASLSVSKGGTVQLKTIGTSPKVNWNTGMNCVDAPSPYDPKPIKPFDCEAHPGPLMLWKDVYKDRHKDYYDIDELDVTTGKFNRVYSIPTSLTSPSFMQLTAAGINPVDGIAYGFVSVSSQGPNWIVRFDENAMEFLSKVDHRSSGGTVSSKGTYYYIGWGKPVPIWSIPEIHKVQGFREPSSSVPKLGKVVAKGWDFYIGDLAAYTGNIEGAGEGDYIIALVGESAGNTLLLVKDAGAQSKYWLLKTTNLNAKYSFNAAWNFMGKVYFTGSDGKQGSPVEVFEVPMESLGTNEGGVLIKTVGKAAKTLWNSGMNCFESQSPFPLAFEECGQDYTAIEANEDGICPDGSFRMWEH